MYGTCSSKKVAWLNSCAKQLEKDSLFQFAWHNMSLNHSDFFPYKYIDVHYSCCAADFSLLNLPKGKSLGRSKPATNS